ncbi:MAG: EAL domain-containing protein [Pigmentiphaga sp.]|uniref:putative bifunctional diguanylate cyclase/phosphodiesterase n=1 Tax=Pigmentiphaga sp. TaxID=1977564 RepID=UPI0029B74C28|nr:EAL domain-containing protein [Pigmentiphaga sp.]MDX3907931.1 EAL domain-containing protein [Pigmentiphaga sp.]
MRLDAPDRACSVSLSSLEDAIDFFARIDPQGRFLHISAPALAFIGYHREYLRIIALRDLVAQEDVPLLDACLRQAQSTGEVQKCTLHLIKTLTYPRLVELRIAPDADRPGQLLVVGHDVSAWADNEQCLTYAMYHDVLTGLDNLASARHEVERAKQEAVDNGFRIALLQIDIDEFHRVNQAFGYEVGDRILHETALRLKSACHAREFVARCYSDAFLILLREVPGRDYVEEFARRISDAIQLPYSHEGQTLQLSVSIGAAMYPDPANGSDQLLHHVDEALAQAGRNRGYSFAFYERRPAGGRSDTLKLEFDLHSGIRNGEFSLHYQPIVEARGGRVVAIEALMRWQHPVLGPIAPDVFISLAESAGLINFLGGWALKNACMQLTQWDARGIHLQYASVNVSARQFRDKRFPAAVREAFRLTGLEPRRIVLEITESVLMEEPDQAKRLLEELTDLGVRFAVDDFGTGYSSLAYLQSFPLAALKIDRRFISNLPSSRNDQAIVEAVVGLARTLGLDLIAEGVETEAQRELLVASGCELIQGWLACEALPITELVRKFEAGELRALDR